MRASLLAVLLCTALAACATPSARDDGEATTFVLVRHAEKDAGEDPGLSAAGRERARRLAQLLSHRRVDAVYATAYRRTQETAAPVAGTHRIDVRTYDAGADAKPLAERLRAAHAGGAAVIVGHSNTVPAIAAALCRCEVAPMSEAEYDRLVEVTIAPDGSATLRQSRYP